MNIAGISVEDGPFLSILHKYFVKELSVCGSRARGDHRPDSDIDLLVEFLPNSKISLIEFIELKLALQDLLGIPVDLGPKNSIKLHAKESILADARIIYSV
jgi:predicted nucleotidyltransferase